MDDREKPKIIPASPSLRKDALTVALLATAYFFAHQIAFLFPDSGKIIMLVWPAGGVALAAFLLSPRRLWPVLTLAFYAAGVSADVLLAGRSFMTGLGYMTGNMVESIGCAWLILRCGGEFRKFSSTREVLALVAGVLFVNAFSAGIGAGTSALTRGASFAGAWFSWYIADGLGVLLLGPFFVTWINLKDLLAGLNFKKILDGVSCMAVWAITALFVFSPGGEAAHFHPYFLVALLALPAMRLGQRGVTLSLVLLFIVAAQSSTIFQGPSPFPGAEDDLSGRLLELQIFIGFMAVVGYLLAAGHEERKRAEAALRDSEEKFRLITQLTPAGMYKTTPKGECLYVNERWREMAGMTSEEALGMGWVKGLHSEDRQSVMDSWQEMVASEGRWGKEYRFQRKDGKITWVYGLATPEKDADGNITGYIGLNVDITERKRVEEAVLKFANEKSKFASKVSHELRSPLATIKAATELVSDGSLGPVNNEQADVLGTARENIDRLGRLVDNILVFQKMEAGKMGCDFRENDINEVVREAHKNALLFAGNRKEPLVLELGSDLPGLTFNRDQILQVLINLMANAVRYSERGGVFIRTRAEAQGIHVSVRDSGAGIKAEYFDGIFEPFAQISGDRKGGTGLGLAISREIILAHHGKIWVESETGKGSTFHFTLPG